MNWKPELLFGISGGGAQRCRGTEAGLVKKRRLSRDMLELGCSNRLGSTLGTTSTSASSGCDKLESWTKALWRLSAVMGSTPNSSSLSSSSPALRARFRWREEANLSRLWSSLSTWLSCIPTLEPAARAMFGHRRDNGTPSSLPAHWWTLPLRHSPEEGPAWVAGDGAIVKACSRCGPANQAGRLYDPLHPLKALL